MGAPPPAGCRRGARRDDLATLRAWLANDRHRARTAAALFVHENTVRYRLRRIGETLGVDLADPEVRFPIGLAVRTLELLDASPPERVGRGWDS